MWVLLSLSFALAASGDPVAPGLPAGAFPCGTPWMQDAPLPPPPDGGEDRDPYQLPNARRGAHVVVRWGSERPDVEPLVEPLLRAFERAWQVEVEELGHTPPRHSDTHLVNVYIGDTGDGAPSASEVGGYYRRDGQGYPMIVLNPDAIAYGEYLRYVAAHELYHAVQDGGDAYGSSTHARWWGEATATWAGRHVEPDNASGLRSLAAYAGLPHRRLSLFDNSVRGSMEESYPYGAAVFVEFLEAHTGSIDIVRDSWETPTDDDDPVETLRDLLAEDGDDLDELWLEHLGRNVTWDYEDRLLYRRLAPVSVGTTVWLGGEGAPEWRSPPQDLLPERYGSNRITLDASRGRHWRFEVDGDESGDQSSPARFGALVVVEDGRGEGRVHRIDLVDNGGSIEVDAEGARRLHLVVGAWESTWGWSWGTERFGYRFRITDLDAPEGERRIGGGCTSVGAAGGGWLVGMLAVLGTRRRRRRLAQ